MGSLEGSGLALTLAMAMVQYLLSPQCQVSHWALGLQCGDSGRC